MKRFFLFGLLFGLLFLGNLQAQTPAFFYHNPANSGVNNLFFHSINGRMLFIYTQSELNAMGLTPSDAISSIWFRHNTSQTTNLGNFRITMGHTSNAVPVANFNNNFNVGTSVVTLNAGTYTYTSNAGTWNVPADSWTEIPLSTPFSWNGNDNLAIQVQFSTSSNSSIAFYADNGGVPITRYHNNRNANNANSQTARPMVGFSSEITLIQGSWNLSAEHDASGQVRIDWSYELPGEVLVYQLERSVLNEAFEGLDQQVADKESSFSSWDPVPAEGLNFYRIRALGRDGKVFHSPTVMVRSSTQAQWDLFPNPVAVHQPLQLLSPVDGKAQVKLIDLKGQVLIQETADFQAHHPWEIPTQNLSPGVYFLHLRQNTRQQTFKVLIRE